MVVVDRAFSGSAAQATLLTAMTPSSPGAGGTITVSDDSGYPSSGKFEIVIDRGTESEENVLINSRAGTTFTIGQRGYDGSVARTHTSGAALVEHDLSGRTVQLFVDHVDDVESDPHSTKLLNNTRHDVEARHTFGAAYGTPVTPAALTPDIAGAAGTGNNPAREDHVHNVPAAVVGSILPDDVAAEGAAASFARSDHTHGITAAVAGAIQPDDSAAEGAATSFARSDHRHSIAAATASTLTGVNAEGSSTSFARADHNHALPSTEGARVETAQTTTSVLPTFADLATVGPSATLTPPASGKVKVHINCEMENNGSSGNWMGFALSGGNTLAAARARTINSVGSNPYHFGATFLLTGLAAVSTTFTAKYAVGGGTGTFTFREIIVEPVLA